MIHFSDPEKGSPTHSIWMTQSFLPLKFSCIKKWCDDEMRVEWVLTVRVCHFELLVYCVVDACMWPAVRVTLHPFFLPASCLTVYRSSLLFRTCESLMHLMRKERPVLLFWQPTIFLTLYASTVCMKCSEVWPAQKRGKKKPCEAKGEQLNDPSCPQANEWGTQWSRGEKERSRVSSIVSLYGSSYGEEWKTRRPTGRL